MDLLGPEEQEMDKRTFEYRFNIALLSERLIGVIKWLRKKPTVSDLSIGLFGASTGAAAAMTAAAAFSREAMTVSIKAIVSRGGRPDLVKPEVLETIETPTLFIVGGKDESVLMLTRETFELVKMKEKEIVVIQEAGHLFEEPGSLEKVSESSISWFRKFLTA
jgi:dienelactone hydrolase